jgi:hypothetical protein
MSGQHHDLCPLVDLDMPVRYHVNIGAVDRLNLSNIPRIANPVKAGDAKLWV